MTNRFIWDEQSPVEIAPNTTVGTRFQDPVWFLITNYQAPEGVTLRIMEAPTPGAATFDIRVEPPLRGQGLGTQALKALCLMCDQLHIKLEIDACPDDKDNLDHTVAWYKRHGFVEDGRQKWDCVGMERFPK